MARPPVSSEIRFWRFVQKTDGCWLWNGAISQRGYGVFTDGTGKFIYAHRFSYQLANGSVPNGLHCDHLCRNPRCVNPKHLEPVTLAENLRRGCAAREPKKICKHGHDLIDENVWASKRGHRYCRACHRRRANESYARKIS